MIFGKFVCDSRDVRSNDCFVAIRGAKVDGTDFLEEAAKKGATFALVSSDYQGDDFGLQLFRVDDVISTLQELAKEVIKKASGKVIAITGSLGKTTTKGFLHTLLSEEFKVMATPGNSNSQVGLPLAILNGVEGDEDYLVLEMGMSQPGEITKLIEMAPPDIALITCIAKMHIIYFENEEAIARAKSEILQHPHTKIAILPKDSPYFDLMCQVGTCQKISFSSDGNYSLDHLPGEHNRYNLLAAIAVAKEVGLTEAAIQRAIPKLTLPEMRLQKVDIRGVTFINDTYNAGPTSMKAALSSLPPPPKGSKTIGVIGEMLELGEYSEEEHRSVARYALDKVDLILCMGKGCIPFAEEWKEQNRNARWFPSREALVETLRDEMQPEDVVLLKGSRLNQLWKVLDEV